MSLFVTSLNSGSNGNCYYVGNDRDAILVDAGISCREIERRLTRLGLQIHKIRAVFVSHEHKDHIKGIPTLSRKYKLPVYITPATKKYGRLSLEKDLVMSFSAQENIFVGELIITAFPKFHDASDPYSFVVSCRDVKVGIFTDIGIACKQVIHHFKQCHAAFLEANYDERMLDTGSYPYFLKSRIRGGKGHLSNNQALELFTLHKPPFMSHLFLSHLSQNNNCPYLVGELFNRHAAGVKMVVTSRFEETPVYQIENFSHSPVKTAVQQFQCRQLSFSFA